ncbi:MAG: oligosaccharide flippase family protein [Bacteroidota bacterium]|nr:oligosaccharide flippase family protein [Bacteroidota bacterium]
MISKILKSEFFKNVATMMTGTAIAQAILLLATLILSRLYTPADFGILAIFLSIATVIGTISTGRYELAIMLPKEERDAKNVLLLALFNAVVVSILTLILVVILKGFIIDYFDSPELDPWLYLIPVYVLAMGVFNSFNYWSTRNKTFRRNAASRISKSGTNAAASIGLGVAKVGAGGLIAGYIIGQFVGAIVLAWSAIRNPGDLRKAYSKKIIKDNARKYSRFLKINTPHAFVDTMQEQVIVYTVICFFSKTILGSYSFAFRILKAPVGLIGNSMYQVFYQKASRALEEGQALRPMVLKIYRNLFLIGFPFFLLVFIFAPGIFDFMFGDKYRVAGEIAQIILPWLFLNFLVMPVTCVAVILNRQQGAFLIAIADIILKVTALLIGGLYGDFKLSFLLMSVLNGALLIFSGGWHYYIAGMKQVKHYE